MSCANDHAGFRRRRRSQAGLTLVELVVAFSILLILSTMAVPMARHQVIRQRENELRADLREVRAAIDKYKDYCDQGKVQSKNPEAYCYPLTLEDLVNGVQLANTISGNGQSGKMRFLRRIRLIIVSGNGCRVHDQSGTGPAAATRAEHGA